MKKRFGDLPKTQKEYYMKLAVESLRAEGDGESYGWNFRVLNRAKRLYEVTE